MLSNTMNVKYIRLRKGMLWNGVSVNKLEKLCGKCDLHRSLFDKSEPRKGTIDAILKVTGLTYEECFMEE